MNTFSDHFLALSLLLWRQEAKHLRWKQASLKHRNLNSKESVVKPGGPIVSLTTFGERVATVHITLESISMGSLLPSRLILWIDNREIFDNRPAELRRLEARGLEVLLTENYGPHTKYFPFLLSERDFSLPMVTADDDVIYSNWWLKGLMASFLQNDVVLNCYRAHRIRLNGLKLAPYSEWNGCQTSVPSVLNFATGVSGCVYPPALLEQLKLAGDGFRSLCPKADDVWLNVIALRCGFAVRQIRSLPLRFPLIEGTQAAGLWNSNVILSQNDSQIDATYTPQDLAILRSRG